MSLFNLKPAIIKVVFVCAFAFLMFFIVIPMFVARFKDGPIILSIFFIVLAICSAGSLAGGVSLLFNEMFFSDTNKFNLKMLTGIFSLATFVSILIKFPDECAHLSALFVLPITNLLLVLQFSVWLHVEQNLSKPLALTYAGIMFIFNYGIFIGLLNRFSYWEGESAAAFSIPVIFFTPIAIGMSFFYLIFIDRKRSI